MASVAVTLASDGPGTEHTEMVPLTLEAELSGEFEGGQGNYSESLGRAIAVDGDSLIAGVQESSLAHGVSGGAAFVFTRQDNLWVRQALLIPSIGCAWGQFGASVAIEGDIAVVGETKMYEWGPGAAFVFVREGQEWRERQMLSASDFSFGDRFGASVAIEGDTIVVGAPDSNDVGAAYVFERVGDAWIETAKLRAPIPSLNDDFGATVALSSGVALIGASGDDDAGTSAGTAYVFRRSGGGSWPLESQLTASDATASDSFGCSVTLDGDTAVVGADGDDDHGSGSGAAYVFAHQGSGWIEQAKLTAPDAVSGDSFGQAVSIDGASVAVGAPNREGGGSPYGGGVYLFLQSGSSWTAQATVEPPEPDAETLFGLELALDGDDLIVGAPTDDLDCANGGSIRTFVRSGEIWTYTQRLTVPRNGAEGHFGTAVSTSGDRLLVGASWDVFGTMREGSATIFVRDGGRWVPEVRLGASDGEGSDLFGWSVSIDGTRAVIGAPDGQTGTMETGAAYVFSSDGAYWSESLKLTPADGTWGGRFGSAVWIEGGTMFVGAEQDDDLGIHSGSVYVFEWDGTNWIESQKLHASDGQVADHFGWSLAAHDDTLLVAARNHPATYVFARTGGVWLESSQLVPSSEWAGPPAVWDDTAIVGSPYEDDGSATIFVRENDIWTETARLTPDPSTWDDRFGFSVAVRDGVALVGANQDLTYRGATYLFELDGGEWTRRQRLTAPSPAAYDQYGYSVALGYRYAVVGALEDDNSWGVEAGSAFVFVPHIFSDSFETGDASAWSTTVP
jgi:hypothetical protein